MKKLIWLWKRIFGKLLIIKTSKNLKKDEVLIYGHCLYFSSDLFDKKESD